MQRSSSRLLIMFVTGFSNIALRAAPLLGRMKMRTTSVKARRVVMSCSGSGTHRICSWIESWREHLNQHWLRLKHPETYLQHLQQEILFSATLTVAEQGQNDTL